jgi:hypothetical protein
VRCAVEDGLECLPGDIDEAGVCDPGAVEAIACLALLVGGDLLVGVGVDLGVAARDEGRHSADGVRAALVTRLHEQVGVGAHEGDLHGDLSAVREDDLVMSELLDRAEDVVPSSRVDARDVIAQLVEELVDFIREQDVLEQHGRLDRASF